MTQWSDASVLWLRLQREGIRYCFNQVQCTQPKISHPQFCIPYNIVCDIFSYIIYYLLSNCPDYCFTTNVNRVRLWLPTANLTMGDDGEEYTWWSDTKLSSVFGSQNTKLCHLSSNQPATVPTMWRVVVIPSLMIPLIVFYGRWWFHQSHWFDLLWAIRIAVVVFINVIMIVVKSGTLSVVELESAFIHLLTYHVTTHDRG